MRKISLIGVAAVAALATSSCDSDVNGFEGNANITVITANIGDASTESRTAIDPTSYDGGHVGLLWTPDDAIGVYGSSIRNARFANQSTSPAGRTRFAGQCADPLYAYYPYSPDNDGSEVTAVKGSLASTQTYDGSTRMIEGDYKYGSPRTGATSEFDFKHIFALLRFNVNATGTDIAGETLKSVSITLPENRKLAGDFTFNLTNGSYSFTGNTSNAVTVEYTNSPVLSDGAVCTAYLSCAPDLREGDEIVVEVRTDKNKASFTAEVAYDFKANAVYTFDLTLSAYKDKGFTVEPLPVVPEEETANCYMITEAGEHDFKATVIGNGEKGIIKGAGFHTENPYINPVSAKLLWEDVQGFVTNVTLRDGRVYYTATANVGNALIAVYDAAGKVLWSWHIWGVGNSLPEDEEITNYNGAKFMMMDRTLGAHSKTSLIVTLYQWGRKDPVPNSAKYWVEGQETDIEQSYPVYTDESITVKTGVEHPGELVSIPYVETNRLLWGDNNITDHYTFGWPNYLDQATAEQTQGWTNGKTIYDPCPVGYRVASKYAWTGFCKNNNGSTPGNSTTSARLDYINYVKYENGFYFKRNQIDEVGIFYPQIGSRSASTGSLWVGGNAPYNTFNYTASYWSSAPQKNNGQSQCLSIGVYDGSGVSSTVTDTKNSVNTLGFNYCVNAYAIRCVREK